MRPLIEPLPEKNPTPKCSAVSLLMPRSDYRVFVCENMAFSGDFEPVLAKHSKNFSLQNALSIGVDRCSGTLPRGTPKTGHRWTPENRPTR
jgi:hypothetical protein